MSALGLAAMPDMCGPGGDLFALWRTPDGKVSAVNGGGVAFTALADHGAGTRGVVGREQAPGSGPEEPLGLAERLDVRIDPLDLVESLSGQRRQAEADGHHDLAHDDETVLQQQVVVLADGPVDEVLDGDDAQVRLAGLHGLEDAEEALHRAAQDVSAEGEDRILGERARLAGIGDEAAGTRLVGRSRPGIRHVPSSRTRPWDRGARRPRARHDGRGARTARRADDSLLPRPRRPTAPRPASR